MYMLSYASIQMHRASTLVHDCAKRNDVGGLRALLDADPDNLHVHGWFRDTPLHTACSAGSLNTARLLLDRGANLESLDRGQFTPLMAACSSGRVELVSFLLDRGADPTVRYAGATFRRETLLIAAADPRLSHWSSSASRVSLVRRLLQDARVEVDAQDDIGYTALWVACFKGNHPIARVLLVEGFADYTIPCQRFGDLDGYVVFLARDVASPECVALIDVRRPFALVLCSKPID